MARGLRPHASVHTRVAFLCLFLSLSLTLPAAAQEPAERQAAADIVTDPVEIDGVVLFQVRGVSSLSATERARLIRGRVIAAAKDPAIAPDQLTLVEAPEVSRIQVNGTTLFSM